MDTPDKFKIEKNNHQYLIAGIVFQVDLPIRYVAEKLLASFSPFSIHEETASPAITVQVTTDRASINLSDATLLSDISVEWGSRFKFYETANQYITTVAAGKSTEKKWYMISTKDFGYSTIHMPEERKTSSGILNWLLMVAFGQASLRYNAVLVHASVVEDNEYGYAFLGKSGTGKSTHSKLWLKHFPTFTLLNDDNPVVRIEESGEVMIYGSPWSGKTPCYRNKGVKLGGLVRLKQAPENRFEYKQNKEALLQVIPSCTAIRWNANLFNKMVSLLTYITQQVPVGFLSCLPDGAAASLCYSEIKKR